MTKKQARPDEPSAQVIQERFAPPYVLYLDSAKRFCGEFDPNPRWSDLLAATTLTALSVEAIANTIGKLTIPRFKEFESSSPWAKVRIIAEHFGIDADPTQWPFDRVKQLVTIRNKLAHPKQKELRWESPVMPLSEAHRATSDERNVLTDIEKVLNPNDAKKFFHAVVELAKMFEEHLPVEQRAGHMRTSVVVLDSLEDKR